MFCLDNSLRSKVVYFVYPQYLWAREINRLLKSGTIPDFRERQIIDAPCGSGVVTFWLKRWNSGLRTQLYDLDRNNVDLARRWFPACNARVADIYKLEVERSDNVWLLINSLYCLPEAGALLGRMARHMEYIVGVFPYLDTKNYRKFLCTPGAHNPSAMTKEQTLVHFAASGAQGKLSYR